MIWAIWLGLICGYLLFRDAFRHFAVYKEGGWGANHGECDTGMTPACQRSLGEYQHWLQESDTWPALAWGLLIGALIQGLILIRAYLRTRSANSPV